MWTIQVTIMSEDLYGPVSFAIGLICCGLPIIAAIIALPFVAMRLIYQRQDAVLKDLKATGYAGEALIISLERTGLRFFASRGDSSSGIPQWAVKMDVHLPNFPTYTVTKTLTFSDERAELIPPGTVVTVLADPKEPQKIGIVWDKTILNDLPKRNV